MRSVPIAIVMARSSTREAFQSLSGLLWQERAELEAVLATLQQSGEALSTAASLGHARHLLSLLELERCVTTHELARDLELSAEASLSELIAHAPPGWAAVLRGHHVALTALAEQVTSAEESFVLGGPHEAQRSLAEFLS